MNKEKFLAIPEKERMNRVLHGTLYWASLHKPNVSAVKQFNGLPAYMVSLVLDEDQIKEANKFGIKVHDENKFVPGKHVKLQRKIRPPKTADTVKIDIVDSMQNPIPSNILIGNGSKAICKFGTGWGMTEPTAYLFKVQIRELVKYEVADKGLVMDEGGFVLDTTDMPTADVAVSDLPFDLDNSDDIFDA